MSPTSCTLCRFYSPILQDANGQGVCRRHPPAAGILPQGIVTLWPTVRPMDWCAEGEQGVSHDSLAAGQNLLDKKNGRH
jgi:hypothetical protein